MKPYWQPKLGAICMDDDTCRFTAWAPKVNQMVLCLEPDRSIPMECREDGYHQVIVEEVKLGQRYWFQLDGQRRPDPASRYQPDGVYGASQVVSHQYEWQNPHWGGLPLEQYIIYEVHVGTFTQEGTFRAMIPHLDYLANELGVTALEIMPISQFPGKRNWGYDGVFPFAVQNNYGTVDDFRELVDACHARGLAVILDVVYNHLGPEGNFIRDFGPYTTNLYRTPWGDAMNFDARYADEVRRYFIENALYWLADCRVDSLRLDATHFIFDHSPATFLEELVQAVDNFEEASGRQCYLMAENDRNDASLTRPQYEGGTGMDAQWNDDFHHSLHTLLLPEAFEYYSGFGKLEYLSKAFREGFVYSGQYSDFRKRRHGSPSRNITGKQFVVFIQNHDQIGNRMPSQRISSIVSFDQTKLAAGAVLLSPYLPMIFMGEEYADTADFNFFTDFQDKGLIQAVREGRKAEFGELLPEGFDPPDPQSSDTMAVSCLNHDLRQGGRHRVLLNLYRELVRLRKEIPALYELEKENQAVVEYTQEGALVVRRWHDGNTILLLLNFSETPSIITVPIPPGKWHILLESSDPEWREEADGIPVTPHDIFETSDQYNITLQPHAFVLMVQDESYR